MVFAPGIYNYSGTGTVSTKAFTLKLNAKTSKESSDYTGGNYLLPIDEPIADNSGVVLPPFTGQAYVRIYLRVTATDSWTIYTATINYSGRNTYVANKVLPSQTLKGKTPKPTGQQ